MNLRSLALAACVLAIGLTPVSAAAAAKRPNIVFILADDLGYVDINAYAARLTGAKTAEMFSRHRTSIASCAKARPSGSLCVPALLADARRAAHGKNRRAHRRDDCDAEYGAVVLQPRHRSAVRLSRQRRALLGRPDQDSAGPAQRLDRSKRCPPGSRSTKAATKSPSPRRSPATARRLSASGTSAATAHAAGSRKTKASKRSPTPTRVAPVFQMARRVGQSREKTSEDAAARAARR